MENVPQPIIDNGLRSFSCDKDSDLTFFLTERAIKFDKLGKSKTFLLLDEDKLAQKEISIVAFFSLAMQIISLPDTLSSNAIKKMDGLSSRIHGKRLKDLSVYLIGQLAKNDLYSKQITGTEILKYAFSEIYIARNIVGGRVVAVDCKNEDKLLNFYQSNGFVRIGSDEITGLEQLVHIIK